MVREPVLATVGNPVSIFATWRSRRAGGPRFDRVRPDRQGAGGGDRQTWLVGLGVETARAIAGRDRVRVLCPIRSVALKHAALQRYGACGECLHRDGHPAELLFSDAGLDWDTGLRIESCFV